MRQRHTRFCHRRIANRAAACHKMVMHEKKETPQVAILVGTARSWSRDVVKGILSYANQHTHWQIWVRPNVGGFYDALPEGWHGDGVIARVTSPALAADLKRSGIPVVNVADTSIEGFTAPCVKTDDAAATRMAAEHFIERGFRNLAVVSPLTRSIHTSYTEHYRKVLAEEELDCASFIIEPQEKDLPARLAPWLESLPKPVGILVLGPANGAAIVEACHTAGLSVPHDVAILCSNYDELMCHACHPPLSGIIPPTRQIGYKAAELLDCILRGDAANPNDIILPPPGLREHASTDTLAVEDPALVQVVKFLQEHAFESISMTDILKIVPMSRRTLERRYQKAFGRTPFDEIKLIRCNHARKLLVETDWPLQIIAEECGYTTYNYLAQVFKQVTGTSPSAYRKRMTAH